MLVLGTSGRRFESDFPYQTLAGYKLKLYDNSRVLIRRVSKARYSWEVVVFYVSITILSKCHSGEGLFDYYFEEFQLNLGRWPNWLRFVIWDHESAGSSPVLPTK